jgi:hypothetical protein
MSLNDGFHAFRRGFQKEVPGEGWAVVIHDDDFLEMRQAIRALRTAGLGCEVAREVVWQACDRGWAIATITSREEADRIIVCLRNEQVQAELLPC